MPDKFQYDVFLSHSAKDKRSKPPTLIHDTGGNAVVRPLAERWLKAEGKRMKDEIERLSSYFFLHTSSFPQRRFLPLRLDDAPVNGSPDSLN